MKAMIFYTVMPPEIRKKDGTYGRRTAFERGSERGVWDTLRI